MPGQVAGHLVFVSLAVFTVGRFQVIFIGPDVTNFGLTALSVDGGHAGGGGVHGFSLFLWFLANKKTITQN